MGLVINYKNGSIQESNVNTCVPHPWLFQNGCALHICSGRSFLFFQCQGAHGVFFKIKQKGWIMKIYHTNFICQKCWHRHASQIKCIILSINILESGSAWRLIFFWLTKKARSWQCMIFSPLCKASKWAIGILEGGDKLHYLPLDSVNSATGFQH